MPADRSTDLVSWVESLAFASPADRIAAVTDRHAQLADGEIDELVPASFERWQLEEAAWRSGHEFWQQVVARDPSPETCWAAGSWVAARKPGYAWFVSWPADLAWYSRDDPTLRPDPVAGLRFADLRASIGDRDFVHEPAAFVAILGSMRLRFQERWEALREFVAPWQEHWKTDQMLQALLALAEAGRGRPSATAIDAAGRPDRYGRIDHVRLHALRMGERLPDQADRIITLTDGMDRSDLNVCWRRAYAHRKLKQWDEASREIEAAFKGLTRHHDLRQIDELIREREMITSMRTLQGQLSEVLDEAVGRFRDEAAAQTRDTTARIVEIVGIFTALITFIVSGLQVSRLANTVLEAAALLGIIGIGLLGFATLLTMMVRHAGEATLKWPWSKDTPDDESGAVSD